MVALPKIRQNGYTLQASEVLVEWEAEPEAAVDGDIRVKNRSTALLALGAMLVLSIGAPAFFIFWRAGTPPPAHLPAATAPAAAAVTVDRPPQPPQHISVASPLDADALLVSISNDEESPPALRNDEISDSNNASENAVSEKATQTEAALTMQPASPAPPQATAKPLAYHAPLAVSLIAGWYVQLPAVQGLGNAHQIASLLYTDGHTAIITDSSAPTNPQFGIVIGPFTTRALAAATQKELAQLPFVQRSSLRLVPQHSPAKSKPAKNKSKASSTIKKGKKRR